MRLGRLLGIRVLTFYIPICLGVVLTVCAWAGYDVNIHGIDPSSFQKMCSNSQLSKGHNCDKKFSDEMLKLGEIVIVEIEKDDSENQILLVAAIQESDGSLPPFILNFSKVKDIKQISEHCHFGIKMPVAKFSQNIGEQLVQKLSEGKKVKLIVQSGVMCELLAFAD